MQTQPLKGIIGNNRENNKKYRIFDFSLNGRWEGLDRWKWVVIDVGVILDTSASHSENFFCFRPFSELGGGPLGHTLGCHRNFDILFFS